MSSKRFVVRGCNDWRQLLVGGLYEHGTRAFTFLHASAQDYNTRSGGRSLSVRLTLLAFSLWFVWHYRLVDDPDGTVERVGA